MNALTTLTSPRTTDEQQQKMRNILVPIDFSPVADNALTTAVELCKEHAATLTLLHVVENRFALFSPKAGIGGAQVLPRLLESAEQNLNNKALQVKTEHDVNINVVVISGTPSYEITGWSMEKDVDLICIGTHGASGIRDFLIGSTAYRVIRYAHCPVLTIPGTSPWAQFRNILFPVRPIPQALRKYETTKAIISKDDAFIHVVGIITLEDAENIRELNKMVSQVRTRILLDSIRCDTDVHICFNAAREVHQIAASEKPDLIVITATIDSALKDFFLNPYTQDIVDHSRHPVLSIKPGNDTETGTSQQLVPVSDPGVVV